MINFRYIFLTLVVIIFIFNFNVNEYSAELSDSNLSLDSKEYVIIQPVQTSVLGVNSSNPLVLSSVNLLEPKYQGSALTTLFPKMYGDIMLVNKGNPLPLNYVPTLVNTGSTECSGVCQGTPDSVAALKKLKSAAKDEGHTIIDHSNYRSSARQAELYNSYVSQHGKEAADKFSARPGYSEHQTGLTYDVYNGDESVRLKTSFGNTKEGMWLANNAHKFGFIIRYTAKNTSITGYQYEPWHIRYIGVEHATAIRASAMKVEDLISLETYIYNKYIKEGSDPNSDTDSDSGEGSDDGFEFDSNGAKFNEQDVEINNVGVDDKRIFDSVSSGYVTNKYVGKVSEFMFRSAQVLSIFLIGYMVILWLLAFMSLSGILVANTILSKISMGNLDVLDKGFGKLGLWTGFSFLVVVIVMTGLLPTFFAYIYHLFSIFVDFISGFKYFY